MPIATAMAVYFILWWLTLFTMLPIGLRTQGEEEDVTGDYLCYLLYREPETGLRRR